ncbi:MAG: DUF86 domain-containing protein [Alphaproteobacteria bacterium]
MERFEDILDSIGRIETYTAGMSAAAFAADDLRRDAVERCLLRISEAARKLEGQAEALAPGQPWAAIRAVGNVLRHEYDVVDPNVLWRIVETDLRPSRQPPGQRSSA